MDRATGENVAIKDKNRRNQKIYLIWIFIIIFSIYSALFALGTIAFPAHVTWNDGHGDIYTGVTLRGEWLGDVRIEYADGSVYTGTLKNGQWEGHGTYASAEGWTYTGAFIEGVAVQR